MELITCCTRCGAKWEGDFEYCLTCEPVLAKAERAGIVGAFAEHQERIEDTKWLGEASEDDRNA
jgi:hypothetical protein